MKKIAAALTFLLLAIVLHTLVDLGGAMFGGNMLLVQTYLAVFAAASLMWILKSKRLFLEREACDPQRN